MEHWASGGETYQWKITLMQGGAGSGGLQDSVTTGGGSLAQALSPVPLEYGDSFQYNGVSWSEVAEANHCKRSS